MGQVALLLDLGNSRLKWSEVDAHGRLLEVQAVSAVPEEWDASGLSQLLKDNKLPIFLSSVNRKVADQLIELCRGSTLHQLNQQNSPLKVLSHNTGSDRIMAAFAAWMATHSACVVADFGTAWTLDFVSADGELCGGAIGAGLAVQGAALASACPHLGEADSFSEGVPQNTRQALAAGGARALALSVKAMADEYAQSHSLAVWQGFYAGGDAQIMAQYLDDTWTLESDLVLKGLAQWAHGVL